MNITQDELDKFATTYKASAPSGTPLDELLQWREDCVKYAMDNSVALSCPEMAPFFNITECACLYCGCSMDVTKIYRVYPDSKYSSKRRIMVRAAGSSCYHKVKRSKLIGYLDYQRQSVPTTKD